MLAYDQGTPKMQEISRAVQEGASAYLRRQFTTLAPFAVIIFGLLFILPADTTGSRIGRSVFFLVGAVFSAFVGFAGMTLATRANVRTAAAAQATGAKAATRVAFRTGGIVGMLTVGLGLLGASVVTLIFKEHAPQVLEGFGFGAALLAMFMRVGGGIFTKAADVGADLVGKVEQGIPEDDPRNAATIADNVGDNVGDCAGMAADLFESYAVTLVASLLLGQVAFGRDGLVLPLHHPRGRRPHRDPRRPRHRAPRRRPQRPHRDQPWLLHLGDRLRRARRDRVLRLPAVVVRQARHPRALRGEVDQHPRRPADHGVPRRARRPGARQRDPGAHRLLHRDRPRPVQDIGRPSLTGAATVILGGISLGLESAVYSAC